MKKQTLQGLEVTNISILWLSFDSEYSSFEWPLHCTSIVTKMTAKMTVVSLSLASLGDVTQRIFVTLPMEFKASTATVTTDS
jgi:hypothetical protein